ncbi:hypothetical protein N566_03020 [Streptomycetaceae bacterium MP113-05]|nr:hypothetical protein N566_03020 [Streptomycetaceae bacterium MP113-05]
MPVRTEASLIHETSVVPFHGPRGPADRDRTCQTVTRPRAPRRVPDRHRVQEPDPP